MASTELNTRMAQSFDDLLSVLLLGTGREDEIYRLSDALAKLDYDISPKTKDDRVALSGTNKSASCFLKIEKIEGSTDGGSEVGQKVHNCFMFDYYIEKSTVPGDTGCLLSTGRVTSYNLECLIEQGSTTADLLSKIAKGDTLGEVTIFIMRKVDEKPATVFAKLIFKNARLVMFKPLTGINPAQPALTLLSMGYESIEVDYKPMTDDGTDKGWVAGKYNISENSSE